MASSTSYSGKCLLGSIFRSNLSCYPTPSSLPLTHPLGGKLLLSRIALYFKNLRWRRNVKRKDKMSVWQLKYAWNASYSVHALLNRDNGGLLPDTYLHIVNKNKRSYISDCWLPGTFSFPAISGGQCPPLLLQVIYYKKIPWLKKIIWVIRVLRRRRTVVVNLFPHLANDYSTGNSGYIVCYSSCNPSICVTYLRTRLHSQSHYAFTNGYSIYWPIKSLTRVFEFSTDYKLSWLKKIIWVIGVLRRTVARDWPFDNLCGSFRTGCRNVSNVTIFLLGSSRNHHHDGNKDVTNLHIWLSKTIVLHALHVQFSFLIFRRRSRSFCDVKWPVLQLCGRRDHMMTNVKFCLLICEALVPI